MVEKDISEADGSLLFYSAPNRIGRKQRPGPWDYGVVLGRRLWGCNGDKGAIIIGECDGDDDCGATGDDCGVTNDGGAAGNDDDDCDGAMIDCNGNDGELTMVVLGFTWKEDWLRGI